MKEKLVRPIVGRKVGGVCMGLAKWLEVDVSIIRVLTLVLALCCGTGFLAYLIAWAVIPSEEPTPL